MVEGFHEFHFNSTLSFVFINKERARRIITQSPSYIYSWCVVTQKIAATHSFGDN